MSILENNALRNDANLKNRELVYVAGLIMVGVVFAILFLSGAAL
jgi:hypothetical protein